MKSNKNMKNLQLLPLAGCRHLTVCARARARARDAAVGLTRQEGQQRSNSSTLRTASSFLRLGAPLVPAFLSPRQRGRGQRRSKRGHYSGQSLGMIRYE